MFSFERNRLRVELQALVRRICDMTAPNNPPLTGEFRGRSRYNRSLPVLLTPYTSGIEDEEFLFAVSKDISDEGLSILSSAPCDMEDVVVAIWLTSPQLDGAESEPHLLRARVRQSAELGGGFWQIGLELVEVLNCRKRMAALKPIARRLLPAALCRESVASL
jgi:hypothetical protein